MPQARIMKSIQIFIPGQPQAKARARSRIVKNKQGKQFTSHYTPANTRKYEEWVAHNARMEIGLEPPIDGPVALYLQIAFEIPTSWPKWKRAMALEGKILPTAKPDGDNVEKAIMDGFNGIVWSDDSYVVSGGRTKIYSEKPGVKTKVVALDAYPCQIKKQPVPEAQLDLAN